jgi:hypothetical protein
MALNTFFQNYEASGEQRLIEDLILESIKIYGVQTFYLPRTLVNQDSLFTEDAISKFDDAYDLEMYVRNTEGFQGEGEFLSRFGIEIRDQITLTISKRRFEEEVTNSDPEFKRPLEGDLVYLPWVRSADANIQGALFQIKFVEHEAVFYQLGNLNTYDIVIERFVYSDERLDTDIKVIDDIEVEYSSTYNLNDNALIVISNAIDELFILDDNKLVDNAEALLFEQLARPSDTKSTDRDDTKFFEDEGSEFIDFSEINPFSEGEF